MFHVLTELKGVILFFIVLVIMLCCINDKVKKLDQINTNNQIQNIYEK